MNKLQKHNAWENIMNTQRIQFSQALNYISFPQRMNEI